MILNPVHINAVSGIQSGEQYQPNGVDLRVDTLMVLDRSEIFEVSEHVKVSAQLREKAIDVAWHDDNDGKGEYVFLSPGEYYLFDTVERVHIPNNASGLIKHRSSSNRVSMRIESGWWDSSYKGTVGGSITVNVTIKLYRNTRIAQLILFHSDANGVYDGQWQNKNSLGEAIEK